MGIKEKLEELAILDKFKDLAIVEKLKEKKKLLIIISSVVVVLILGLIGLAMLGQEEERKQPIIFSQPASPPVNENQTEPDSMALPENASEEEVEAEIQKIMSEVEMLTVKQEQVTSKIETLKQQLDQSDEMIVNKKTEIENLNKQKK